MYRWSYFYCYRLEDVSVHTRTLIWDRFTRYSVSRYTVERSMEGILRRQCTSRGMKIQGRRTIHPTSSVEPVPGEGSQPFRHIDFHQTLGRSVVTCLLSMRVSLVVWTPLVTKMKREWTSSLSRMIYVSILGFTVNQR